MNAEYEKIFKILKKSLDKYKIICYNIYAVLKTAGDIRVIMR